MDRAHSQDDTYAGKAAVPMTTVAIAHGNSADVFCLTNGWVDIFVGT